MSLFAVSNVEPCVFEQSDTSQDPVNILTALETQAAREYDNFIAVKDHISREDYIDEFIAAHI